MSMENNFLCPRCRGLLNIGGYLVFSVKANIPRGGLVFLSPEIGDYKVVKHPRFNLEEGTMMEFYCPICHRKLRCSRHPGFARILMVNKDFNECEILFSRKVGEKSTFKIKDGSVEEYGKHSELHNKFIKSIQESHPYKNL